MYLACQQETNTKTKVSCELSVSTKEPMRLLYVWLTLNHDLQEFKAVSQVIQLLENQHLKQLKDVPPPPQKKPRSLPELISLDDSDHYIQDSDKELVLSTTSDKEFNFQIPDSPRTPETCYSRGDFLVVKVSKKKERHKYKEQPVSESIPDSPTLEDFVCSGSSPVCSRESTPTVICSQRSNNIENELLDAVKDVCDTSHSETERNKQDYIDNAITIQVHNVGLEDVKIEFSSSKTEKPDGWRDDNDNILKKDVSIETEMKEIHSYRLSVKEVNTFEEDTKLESPRHSISESSVLSKVVVNESSSSTADEQKDFTTLTTQEVTPTVKIEKAKGENLLLQEKTKVNITSAIETKSTIENGRPQEQTIEEVRPFTEVQLSALYSNQELDYASEFTKEFIENHALDDKRRHYLYELLVSYLRSRNRLIVDAMNLEALTKECKEHQNLLWMIETTVVTESGECQDGNPVSASHEYKVSHFNKMSHSALNRSLTSIRDLVNEVHSLNAYSSEVLKMQVENYVQGVCTFCPEFSQLPHNAPVALHLGDPPLHMVQHLRELRMCITVLFSFQRRAVKDTQFVEDTRDWLSRLVAVLLRVATWKDHMFLLHHVLRCPSGVGTWATNYVQIPPLPFISTQYGTSPFASPHLGHMVAALATILLPIQEREQFLHEVQSCLKDSTSLDTEGDSLWILVDSDGEGDEDDGNSNRNLLKENDMVALLNQIPMDILYRHVLLINRRDERDIYDVGLITEHHLLRLFAFSTVLVRLLRQGLKTYGTPRYRQFAKRLGRLIRHTVQYASDQWESFRRYTTTSDAAMLRRIQVEYDAFFLRATQSIFSSQRLGAWQFLAVIPYNVVSVSTLWKLFYILHHDCNEDESLLSHASIYTGFKNWEKLLVSPDLKQQFEEKLEAMPEAESFYLLTTFANMAMARSDNDMDFIRVTTLDLFRIGFLSGATKELCSKPARMLLANITSKHPSLISDLLVKLRDNFSLVGKVSNYATSVILPQTFEQVFSVWAWETISRLRLHVLDQQHHIVWTAMANPAETVRDIPDLEVDQELELLAKGVRDKQPIACYVAILLTTWGYSIPLICTKGFMQVQLLLCYYKYEAIIEILHHVMPLFLCCEESLIKSDRFLSIIISLLTADRTYIKLAKSLISTDFPGPVLQSFGQMIEAHLEDHHRFSLINPQAFIKLWMLALTLVPGWTREPSVVYLLDILCRSAFFHLDARKTVFNMLSKQFEHENAPRKREEIKRQQRSSSKKRGNGACFINPISHNGGLYFPPSNLHEARPAIHFPSAPIQHFSPQLSHSQSQLNPANLPHPSSLNQSLATRNAGTISSFITWVASGSGYASSLLARPSSPECPWFAYQVLELEQEILEEKTGLWGALLRELATATGKTNVDQALKKAAQSVKMAAPPSSSLSIYRWAQQALDTPLDHPLMPLLWQKFFTLYLARIPSTTGLFSLVKESVTKLRSGIILLINTRNQPLYQESKNDLVVKIDTSVQDRGGVGDKFFEGMLNLSFHKKLKKRLQDATEYFRSKSTETNEQPESHEVQEKPTDEDNLLKEMAEFYARCCRLMRTFSLWLEEPRLHEPNLFLPALPPQYDSNKLEAILNGNKIPWLEYLDYGKVRESQQQAFNEWKVTHFREQIIDYKSLLVPKPEEATDPKERILKRLQLYDSPVPPSPMRTIKALMPPIRADTLLNKGSVLDQLKPSFKSLLEYAQIYSIRMSEHTALDCSFLELVPQLYKDMEFEVVLNAACDCEPHMINRRPSVITCAGPATIRLRVCEARVNEGAEHMIEQNRDEYNILLQRALQPPPQKVCCGSVFIEHVITLLEAEFEVNKAQGNAHISAKLQDLGVTLFYYMISLYNEESAFYPATKQLLTTCIERVGQVFVSGDESQCLRLLATITQQPRLAGVLGPHFTPAATGTVTFLQCYAMVVDIVDQQTSAELCFVLLSKRGLLHLVGAVPKARSSPDRDSNFALPILSSRAQHDKRFDVVRWLVSRRPRLSERSQFINLVGKALTSAGLNPEDDKLMLHEVFRKHLRFMLLHDFPEHYGDVLHLLLKASENQSLALDVWFDLLNALVTGKDVPHRRLRQGLNLGKLKDEIRKYATEQKLLAHDELRETAILLANHFTKERLQYGLYGLYPKYRVYVEPLTTFLGMMGHALVVSTLQRDRGTLSDKLCEHLWPALCDMFSPWMAPYLTRNLKEPTAAWIQQLTDDRSVLLPWIIADGPHAHRMVAMFTECVRFILDTLPGKDASPPVVHAVASQATSFVSYGSSTSQSFALTSVKDYVLNVIHASFLSLPWDRFWPSIHDLDLMLKVVDQYLPECHTFLGSVFIEVPWWTWVGHVLTAYTETVAARTHVCLLHLLVKLANEPNVRQSTKVAPLLLEAQKFAWHLVDAASYNQVVNWCVMSCDPRVILTLDQETGPVDVYTLELLQVVAAYTPTATHFHQSTLHKRQVFVRACVKLILSCASRYKVLLSKKEIAFQAAVRKLLDDVELVVTASVPAEQQVSEAGMLLAEILATVNQPVGSAISVLSVNCFIKWISARDSTSVVLQGLLRVLGTTVTHSEYLGSILEAALQAFFRQTVSQTAVPQWQHVMAIYQSCIPRQPPVEDTLLSGGHLLSVYAQLMKILPSCRDISEEGSVLITLVKWLNVIKPTETLEGKLPLFWGKILTLSFRQCEYSGDPDLAMRSLQSLMNHLSMLAEDKTGGWGILGAIGLRKQSPVSKRCRMLSQALSVYILAQLPEGDDVRIRTTPNALGAVTFDNPDNRSNSESNSLLSRPEVHKVLASMETLTNTKQYQEFRNFVDLVTRHTLDSNNSLHNAAQVLGVLATELYQQEYLNVLKM
uniref:(California timema) hypothetical protein n=1 Tax=Timema californicum TaxID=61474 RepID=A0A7R9IYQ5_TIMCA|nr:unnamed protein product [Timema californicum]